MHDNSPCCTVLLPCPFLEAPAENKELLHRGLRVQGAGEFYTENPIHNVTVREAPGPRALRRTSNCKCLQNEADANRPDSGEAQRVKCLRPTLSRAAGQHQKEDSSNKCGETVQVRSKFICQVK